MMERIFFRKGSSFEEVVLLVLSEILMQERKEFRLEEIEKKFKEKLPVVQFLNFKEYIKTSDYQYVLPCENGLYKANKSRLMQTCEYVKKGVYDPSVVKALQILSEGTTIEDFWEKIKEAPESQGHGDNPDFQETLINLLQFSGYLQIQEKEETLDVIILDRGKKAMEQQIDADALMRKWLFNVLIGG